MARKKILIIAIASCTFCFIFSVCVADDFVYDSKRKRDPFIPLVGLTSGAAIKELVDVTSMQDIVLGGIVYDKKSAAAIVNGTFVKEGMRVGLVFIEKIEPKKVILVIEDDRHEVLLTEEEGGG